MPSADVINNNYLSIINEQGFFISLVVVYNLENIINIYTIYTLCLSRGKINIQNGSVHNIYGV